MTILGLQLFHVVFGLKFNVFFGLKEFLKKDNLIKHEQMADFPVL